MKKAIKNYFAKLQENDKKGFSLVELIIVMAIMAILVGIVASQVLPYMEKSRQSKDQQILSSLCTDITSAIAQSGESCTGGIDALTNLEAITNAKTVTELQGLRSDKSLGDVDSDSSSAFGSKLFKGGTIYVQVDNATGKIRVWCTPGTNAPSSATGSNSAAPTAGSKNVVENEQ